MKLNKYRVTFLIELGKEKHIESVEIKASDEVAAQTGAFKTKINKKYSGKGYRFYVYSTERLDV